MKNPVPMVVRLNLMHRGLSEFQPANTRAQPTLVLLISITPQMYEIFGRYGGIRQIRV
jgi:hypothetical protein